MKTIMITFLCFIALGCAHQPAHYYWGNYEQQIYDMYKNPDQATASLQLEKLNTDIQLAQSKGKPVPPGVYAHMGMLYASIGEANLAQAAFVQEKERYPESQVMINRLLAKLEAH